jgi:L-fuculokinase
MSEDLVIVLDCGGTNLRAVAVTRSGRIVARAAEPNATVADPDHDDWHYWPLDAIYDKLARCARKVAAEVDADRVRAVTVTTFGVDGTFVDASGKMTFPVISWKCPRTVEAQGHMRRFIDPDQVVALTGVGHFAFNTLNKFIWFRENRPDLLDGGGRFLFISSLLTHRLTGRLTSDATMVGTSQMADIRTQDFSEAILSALAIDRSLFPELVFPGDLVGHLRPEAAEALGLRPAVPVISAGHDTQFAVFGAGAAPGQPVLSSGTWEILMARCDSVALPEVEEFGDGFTCEWDVLKGHYNPGFQYVASAIVEWVAHTMFSELTGAEKYAAMIREAEVAPPDCGGVTLAPDLLGGHGAIAGLSLDTERGTLVRAALQALVGRLKVGLGILERAGSFKATALTLVGGGARNRFWTQLKADALGIPVRTLTEPETTVLGAAMFAFAGAGVFASAEEAREAFNLSYTVTMPESASSARVSTDLGAPVS